MSPGSTLGDVGSHGNSRSAHLCSVRDLMANSQLVNELVRYDAQVNCPLPHLKFFVVMYSHVRRSKTFCRCCVTTGTQWWQFPALS
jgi:hypothetical protein